MNENQRRRELKQFGITTVCEKLAQNGWSNCVIFGGDCYDIEAHKNGVKHLFSVRPRNHTSDKNELKDDPYNLFYNKKKNADPDAELKKAEAIAQQLNATAMWAAVRVAAGRQTHDVYYGHIDALDNKRRIPMSAGDRLRHKKLAENAFDKRINPEWTNVKPKRSKPV
jgi:hypothetical protein